MYRRPRFLEVLFRIREEMAREADYDTDLFGERIRSGRTARTRGRHPIAEAPQNGNLPGKGSAERQERPPKIKEGLP